MRSADEVHQIDLERLEWALREAHRPRMAHRLDEPRDDRLNGREVAGLLVGLALIVVFLALFLATGPAPR